MRLLNIEVPPPNKGGIIDRVGGSRRERAKRSVRLIGQLERGYVNNHGQVFPRWLGYLLSDDRSRKITRLADKFVRHVHAHHNGYQKRFAQKFGIVYAAMRIGVDAGLLPWSKKFPLRVAAKCYQSACENALDSSEVQQQLVKRLASILSKPNRLIDLRTETKAQAYTRCGRRCIGFRYSQRNREKFGVFDDALLKIFGTKNMKAAITKALSDNQIIDRHHGHAGTIQIPIPIQGRGDLIKKPHVWEIDTKRLRRFIRE